MIGIMILSFFEVKFHSDKILRMDKWARGNSQTQNSALVCWFVCCKIMNGFPCYLVEQAWKKTWHSSMDPEKKLQVLDLFIIFLNIMTWFIFIFTLISQGIIHTCLDPDGINLVYLGELYLWVIWCIQLFNISIKFLQFHTSKITITVFNVF